MKRLICVVAGLALSAGLAAAQPHEPRMAVAMPLVDIERLTVLLDLDEYQAEEVERVLAEQRGQRRVGTYEEMEAHRAQMRDNVRGQLEAVLSEDQLTKLEVLMEPPPGRMMLRKSD